jgi:DNA-binding transcriptional MerR regulator
MTLTVSKLAAEVGVKADTVRYYEKAGLLPAPERSESGYRAYDEGAVDRLRFIKGVQAFGLRLREVRELLDILDQGACPCGHTEILVNRRVAEINDEIERLGRVRKQLVTLADRLAKDPRPASAGRWPCEEQFVEKGGASDDGF